MANNPKKSFSAGRRWGMFLSVMVSIAAVAALVVMANYLAIRYYARFTWSAQTQNQLSPQTLGLLKSITNEVKVVMYYDKKDDLYSSISSLLDEYRLRNSKISVETVDYLVDSARALVVKEAYKNYLGVQGNKNLVIFDCNGRHLVIPGQMLGQYKLEKVQGGEEREFRNKLIAFQGEQAFSGALLAVTNPKPLMAYFIEGHGEHPSNDDKEDSGAGYGKFKALLMLNYIQSGVINNLLDTNTIPADCNLLIIAGTREKLPPPELDKIREYLNQGGRLLVLFNFFSANTDTGLEPMLADWGVNVGRNIIRDPGHSSDKSSGDGLVVGNFNPNHPLVNPLLGSSLELYPPRSISANTNKPGVDAPRVDELAFAEPTATINGGQPAGHPIPLMVAVEKGSAKGGFPERGSTRILVAGDSFFLDNFAIDAADNRDFANCAVNWLLDRRALMEGIGPKQVMEYKLMMTPAQVSTVRWIFLGAMPGAFLLLGGLVWLLRRH
jgi:hypothetical protein